MRKLGPNLGRAMSIKGGKNLDPVMGSANKPSLAQCSFEGD